MNRSERDMPASPGEQRALQELQGMIAARYPSASFVVSHGDDPEGFYLSPTVDVEDTTEVLDVIRDRLFEMQVDDGLDVYVTPVRPVQRVLEEVREQQKQWPRGRRGSILDLEPRSKVLPH